MNRGAAESLRSNEEAVLDDLTRNRLPKNPALTGIRGYAALWVVFAHICIFASKSPSGSGLDKIPILRSGYLGVDLFFILSGFVLFLNYNSTLMRRGLSGLRAFVIGRAFRILPLHWIVLIAYIPLVPAMRQFGPAGSDFTVPSFLDSFFLVQTIVHNGYAWNSPAWSLSAECVAYAVFPFLLMAVRRIESAKTCLLGCLAGFTLLIAVCSVSGQVGLNHFQRLGLPRCLAEFPIGMLLCRIVDVNPDIKRFATPLFWAGLCSLGIALLNKHFELAAIPGFCLLILSCSNHGGVAQLVFGNRIAHFLGEVSFSIYLLHIPALYLFLANIPLNLSEGALVAALIFFVLVLIPLAWTTWRLIEVPAQARGREINRLARERSKLSPC